MHDIETFLSGEEMRRVEAAAKAAGMTVEEYVTHAARSEFRARYVLPRTDGKVLPFRAPKRDKP